MYLLSRRRFGALAAAVLLAAPLAQAQDKGA